MSTRVPRRSTSLLDHGSLRSRTVRKPPFLPPYPLQHAYLMVLISPHGRITDVGIMSDDNPTVIHSMGAWARICGAEAEAETFDAAYRAVEYKLRTQPSLAWAYRLWRRGELR